jgi:lipoprotein-anchoring transpeptidase ErfK/SrfK
MTGYHALKIGVAAAALSFVVAGPASADGIFDLFLGAPNGSSQTNTAPLREGRSVATTGAESDIARPAALSTRVAVQDPTEEKPGTITIDTKNRYLYLSMPGGEAMRYDIGVGRDGFRWSGDAYIARRAEWPDWTPPVEMIKRRPDIPHFMKGGIDNPLGARALYLYNGKGDTGFRIHGTNEPDTIGQAVSSGCIRLMNNDVIDLYGRIKVGSKVVVLP